MLWNNHAKTAELESTVSCLGIEIDVALEISAQSEARNSVLRAAERQLSSAAELRQINDRFQ